MYAIDFEYNGERLSDYGMIIGSFSSTSVEAVSSGGDIVFNQIKTNNAKFNLVSSSYDNCYTTTFEIIKNPCISDDMSLSPTLVSQLQRWLSRRQYEKFKIIQDDYADIFWRATFSCKQILIGGKIVGLELTMYTEYPYAFSDEVEITYDCSGENLTFDVYNLSDEVGVLYPRFEVTLNENCEEFIIKNITDNNRKTIIYNCVAGEVINFSGNTKIFTSSNGLHSSIPHDFNYIFPRLINDYNDRENTFTVNASCRIKIMYAPIKKIGL